MCEKIEVASGLSPLRTIRVLGVGFLLTGIFCVGLGIAFCRVENFAVETLDMAVSRYGSLTGKIALNTFEEDKLLMQKILFAKDSLLPVLSAACPVSLALGVLAVFAGVASLLFPVRISSLLVKCRLLKEFSGEEREENFPKISKKVWVAIFALSGFLLLVVGVFHFSDPSKKTPEKRLALEREATRYYRLERAYFSKAKKIGSWKLVGYEPSPSDYFVFKMSNDGFWVAENREAWEDCPAGNRWKIGFEVSGFFDKKLNLRARVPKDSNCARLTPGFRTAVGKGVE